MASNYLKVMGRGKDEDKVQRIRRIEFVQFNDRNSDTAKKAAADARELGRKMSEEGLVVCISIFRQCWSLVDAIGKSEFVVIGESVKHTSEDTREP